MPTRSTGPSGDYRDGTVWYILHDNTNTRRPDRNDIPVNIISSVADLITATVPRDIIDTIINPFLQHTVAPVIRTGLALSS